MSQRNHVRLLLYDYKLVGTTMGTHSSVLVNDQEYWFRLVFYRIFSLNLLFAKKLFSA